MNTIDLTTDERDELKRAIQDAKTYRSKKLKELTAVIIGATILGLGVSYWTGTLSWAMIFIVMAFGLVGLLLFGLAWQFADRPIKKMEKDLELGFKLTGISEIKTINIFNRAIKLGDGTIVYEDNFTSDKWTRGDKIFYRTTNSGEHLFECKRVE